jgi:hypothetical protein
MKTKYGISSKVLSSEIELILNALYAVKESIKDVTTNKYIIHHFI